MNNIFDTQTNYKFLVVETNFRVYAYSSSPLEIAIIKKLFKIKYIFNGFIVADITRKKTRKILKRGISYTKVNMLFSTKDFTLFKYSFEKRKQL